MATNVYPFEKPEFGNIRYSAYNLLLAQKRPHIGMQAKNIIIPGKRLVFASLQDYSMATGVSMYDLTANGKISLGCNISIGAKTYILLHNEDISSECCENWTNLHEIGHICLGHEENGDKEEVEAHFFAACYSMPDAIIWHIEEHGVRIDKYFLMEYFHVSAEAAEKKINTLSTAYFKTSLDDQIIETLHTDINYIIRDATRAEYHFINFATL